ncbi:MAG TPA: transcription elongation factor GreA [Propioniciclava sp.]|jgi:transcription elongation factor GreA|uniref:transcription elongation factor GreA n=1 Tax=Propioniciclava sp. TaxID=2038686 RepID=UPI002BE756CA|nr:transcription elongation factor GreA [Propioniciclava sp.]HRL49969.1 transcription elongation factor GreA [Propioniciclava sp.]HRL81009.1 transcription elongation factor GreA [Propioniciclava sp.]
MSDAQNSTVWLTQEAFDKLTDELDYLKGEGRTTVSAKIAQARDEGDLSENGGYHAAREEQGQQEARIRQLEAMLRDAKIGEAPAGSKKVAPGMTVTIAYDDDPDDTDTFLLGSRELIGVTDTAIDVFSPQSPLGAAIVGAKKGQKVSYAAPNGSTINVTILEFGVYSG